MRIDIDKSLIRRKFLRGGDTPYQFLRLTRELPGKCDGEWLLRAEQSPSRSGAEKFVHLHRQRPGVQCAYHGDDLARRALTCSIRRDFPAECVDLFFAVVGTSCHLIGSLGDGGDE